MVDRWLLESCHQVSTLSLCHWCLQARRKVVSQPSLVFLIANLEVEQEEVVRNSRAMGAGGLREV